MNFQSPKSIQFSSTFLIANANQHTHIASMWNAISRYNIIRSVRNDSYATGYLNWHIQ